MKPVLQIQLTGDGIRTILTVLFVVLLIAASVWLIVGPMAALAVLVAAWGLGRLVLGIFRNE